jgi:hypothetical protein
VDLPEVPNDDLPRIFGTMMGGFEAYPDLISSKAYPKLLPNEVLLFRGDAFHRTVKTSATKISMLLDFVPADLLFRVPRQHPMAPSTTYYFLERLSNAYFVALDPVNPPTVVEHTKKLNELVDRLNAAKTLNNEAPSFDIRKGNIELVLAILFEKRATWKKE